MAEGKELEKFRNRRAEWVLFMARRRGGKKNIPLHRLGCVRNRCELMPYDADPAAYGITSDSNGPPFIHIGMRRNNTSMSTLSIRANLYGEDIGEQIWPDARPPPGLGGRHTSPLYRAPRGIPLSRYRLSPF